ncbi:hypothetical protein [Haliea sp. E17]|uniref:hypothetical protein n=1 Tax=Haliea sp. E17 TaxID=3401576 RepID=UPI003AAB82E1
MNTLKAVPVIFGLLLAAAPALADKPRLIDCNAEKAARNAAMQATVGVHGPCDPDKLAQQKKEDARGKMDDARENVLDQQDDLRDKLDDRDHKKKDD